MSRYHYSFITHSTFLPAVDWHFFKLRAAPCDNEFQQVEKSMLQVHPQCQIWHNRDGLGNDVQWGTISLDHATFCVESSGIVVQTAPYMLHESPSYYYLASTRLTTCTPDMPQVWNHEYPFDIARDVMHYVHNHICYTPGHSTVRTTAAEIFVDPRGVCQDYAHLMIALCRKAGIYARYVCGLIAGEGQTHAWVEVSDGKVWRAFDPTHDIEVDYGYIKIAHGRDADDCPVNRGRIYAWTTETMTVMAKVE